MPTRITAFPVFAKDDGTGSSQADPTMKEGPGKPGEENVPPKGGEAMSPEDSKHPYPKPGNSDREG